MKFLDDFIHAFLRSPDFKSKLELTSDDEISEYPVTITYAIERLIITHIKLFMLEDDVRDQTLSDEGIGKLKRRIDYWNGIVRPRLIDALGNMLTSAVKNCNEELVQEPNFKSYGDNNG